MTAASLAGLEFIQSKKNVYEFLKARLQKMGQLKLSCTSFYYAVQI
jgi:hypothetical protein